MTNVVTFDDFLPSYDELRGYANTANFKDEVNIVDGVTYPLICKEIPQIIKNDIAIQISKKMNRMIKVNAMFIRLSTESVNVPHQCHHDLSMGKYSFMLYMSCSGSAGTAFVRHKETGADKASTDELVTKKIIEDQNNVDAWQETTRVIMKENRAAIFDASQLHCAEPVGGFGSTPTDGRMVLTVFYD